MTILWNKNTFIAALAAILLASLALLLAGCETAPTAASTPQTTERVADYDRDDYTDPAWPHHWPDEDGDCQNARHEVLARDAEEGSLAMDGCYTGRGRWIDPYTGESYEGSPGGGAIQIDHVVSVHDAHYSGAWKWSAGRKRAFYSDEENLVATIGEVNQAKGAQTPDKWMSSVAPDRQRDYACAYRQTKAKWGLEESASQSRTLNGIIGEGTCQ